jgi:hypothetical protein
MDGRNYSLWGPAGEAARFSAWCWPFEKYPDGRRTDQRGHSGAAEGDFRAASVPGRCASNRSGRAGHARGKPLEITPASNAGYALTEKNDGGGRGNPSIWSFSPARRSSSGAPPQGAPLTCTLCHRNAPDGGMDDKAARVQDKPSALDRQTAGATSSGY